MTFLKFGVDLSMNPPFSWPAETTYEDITVTLLDGRKISWPKGDYSRFSCAAVCSIAAKMIKLREILKECEIPESVRRQLEVVAEPFSFEDRFLKGNSVEKRKILTKIGEEYEKSMDSHN